mmetsp:Transcript_14062/g.41212  ORF Transcript_14062/g.41212 Transcript_14062/m.41212 type:complete len:93 (+) Transcript_14062:464-742(+)
MSRTKDCQHAPMDFNSWRRIKQNGKHSSHLLCREMQLRLDHGSEHCSEVLLIQMKKFFHWKGNGSAFLDISIPICNGLHYQPGGSGEIARRR